MEKYLQGTSKYSEKNMSHCHFFHHHHTRLGSASKPGRRLAIKPLIHLGFQNYILLKHFSVRYSPVSARALFCLNVSRLRPVVCLLSIIFVKLNLGFPWQNQRSTRRCFLHKQIGLKFKEETCEMLHFKCCCLWHCDLDTSESRSEIRGKF